MDGEKLTAEALRVLAERFQLLSSPTRLAILQELCGGERAVSELLESTGLQQANLSKHVGLLSRAGLIRRRAEGIHVYYALAHGSLPDICETMKKIVLATEKDLLGIFR
jgi:DNA-binding transcriptional ArsR family regulator